MEYHKIERVFIVSIRKDIDPGDFKFPEPFELDLRLKDLLDDEVDEKYYLSKTLNISPKKNYLQWDNSGKGYNSQAARAYYQDGLAPTLSHCNSNGDKSQVVLSNKQDLIEPVCINSKGGRGGIDGLQPSVQDRVYDSEAISTAVTTSYMPSVLVKEATKKGYAEAFEGDSINLEQPNSKTRRGRVGRGVAQTVTTSPQQATVLPQLRIRKLTPLECFRLMGFDDEDFYKAEKVNSNTQLYKQAGNSIVVDVLVYLFKEILEVIDMKKVDDKIVVFEGNDLIDLVALKEKEPELYEELLADYPCESGTYIFKHESVV